MRNELKTIALLSCLACSGTALAQTTAGELSRIEAETTLLKATAKKVEVQAQIAAKQAEIDRLNKTSSNRDAMPAGYGDPTVHAVEGIGRNRYATLNFGGGVMMDVRVGDVLPNGMKVISINPNEVIIGSGKKNRVRLVQSGYPVPAPAHSGAPLPTLPAPSAGLYSGGGAK
jgi:type IV pilus biogenesis protein PilP